jgi:hypothetical protein
MLGSVIRTMQRMAKEDGVAMKDGVPGHFYTMPRPHFPIKVTFARLGDIWVIMTDRPDPTEPDAARALKIVGNEWQLMTHDDQSAEKEHVIAKGSF